MEVRGEVRHSRLHFLRIWDPPPTHSPVNMAPKLPIPTNTTPKDPTPTRPIRLAGGGGGCFGFSAGNPGGSISRAGSLRRGQRDRPSFSEQFRSTDEFSALQERFIDPPATEHHATDQPAIDRVDTEQHAIEHHAIDQPATMGTDGPVTEHHAIDQLAIDQLATNRHTIE